MIDLAPAASTARVNIKLVWLNRGSRRRRQINLVFYWLLMIRQLQVRSIDAVKFPHHSQKICLSTKQLSHDDSCALAHSCPAQMFKGEDSLRLDELLIKLRERQLRRQYCMLDVEQAVIACGQAA